MNGLELIEFEYINKDQSTSHQCSQHCSLDLEISKISTKINVEV